VKEYGISLAIEMIRHLVNEAGVTGVHFCTLNLEKSVQRVLEGLNWASPTSVNAQPNKLITVGLKLI
jgi:methylenetetrahydrofolate reductase (NADPH)